MYESELALRLTPYVAGEQPKNRKFIKLNTNENPYPPSPRVAEVLRSFDAASLRLYPDMDATACAKPSVPSRGFRRTGCSAATAQTKCWRLRLRRFSRAKPSPFRR